MTTNDLQILGEGEDDTLSLTRRDKSKESPKVRKLTTILHRERGIQGFRNMT